jgi:hypothetical protein
MWTARAFYFVGTLIYLVGCGTESADGESTNDGGGPAVAGGAGGQQEEQSVVDEFSLDPTSYRDVSPGSLELRLVLNAATSYCDLTESCVSPGHFRIQRNDLDVANFSAFSCSWTSCETCNVPPCLGINCDPMGLAISGTLTQLWDGVTWAEGTCDASTPCTAAAYVPPGDYVAVMCATPGEPSADGTACENVQPAQCVEVPFTLPGDELVEGVL